jgi:hypothetical protein
MTANTSQQIANLCGAKGNVESTPFAVSMHLIDDGSVRIALEEASHD